MLDVNKVRACLRLFKGYLVDDNLDTNDYCKNVSEFKEDMLKHGLIFACHNSADIPATVVEQAIDMYGIKAEEWNQTFHKSFATVRDTDIETLVVQQIVHYITTYGFEALGIYDKDTVYIPKEELDIPELEKDIKLIVISWFNLTELQIKLMTLLSSGIALSKETIEDIMTLSDYIPRDRFDEIKNKEIRIALYDKYNIVPKNNVEFLRYMIYKLTGSTLLIKNQQSIKALKQCDKEQIYNLLQSYLTNTPNGYIKLAEIFLRYKDLFLALKRPLSDMYDIKDKQINMYINSAINKISKLSKKYHKPLDNNILDRLSNIKDLTIYNLGKSAINSAITETNSFRLIRILNGLKYRLSCNSDDAIVYKIRNGKAYVSELEKAMTEEQQVVINDIITNIEVELASRIKNKLKDKIIYIPENVVYTLPQSEKQFNGNIPEGSYIEVKKDDDMLVGVHWKNFEDERIDLDLHMQNKSEQYGWNTSYRSESENFYFSGDVTDAVLPKGATEVFYIGKSCENKAFLLTLNDYTRNKRDIPYDLIFAKSDISRIEKNHTIDPNNILYVIHNTFEAEENEKTIGLVKIDSNSIRLYFNDFSLGRSIVTRQTNVIQNSYSYLNKYTDIQYKLNDLLTKASITVINKPEYNKEVYFEKLENNSLQEIDNERAAELIKNNNGNLLFKQDKKIKADIDLSIENINKQSLIELFTD